MHQTECCCLREFFFLLFRYIAHQAHFIQWQLISSCRALHYGCQQWLWVKETSQPHARWQLEKFEITKWQEWKCVLLWWWLLFHSFYSIKVLIYPPQNPLTMLLTLVNASTDQRTSLSVRVTMDTHAMPIFVALDQGTVHSQAPPSRM